MEINKMVRSLLVSVLFFSGFPCFAGDPLMIENFMETGKKVSVTPRAGRLKKTEVSRPDKVQSPAYGYTYPRGFSHIEEDFINHVMGLPATEGTKVLDVACGNGHIYAELHRRTKSQSQNPQKISVVLNEINPEFQTKLREFPIDNPIFKPLLSKAPILEHLLKNKVPYKAINCSMFLHFLSPVEYIEALAAFNAHLEPNGLLFVIQSPYFYPRNDRGAQDFETNKKNGSLFPGYATSRKEAVLGFLEGEFFKLDPKQMANPEGLTVEIEFPKGKENPYINYNLHDEESLRILLEKCGFEVERVQMYLDVFLKKGNIAYVGAIAKKKRNLSLDEVARLKEVALKDQKRKAEYGNKLSINEEDIRNFNSVRRPYLANMEKYMPNFSHKE